MREVQASDAKTHLAQLLDEVEQGETLVITRHGKPIARLTPEKTARRAGVQRAIARIQELRKHTKPMSVQELLSARDEGRKG